LKLRILVVALFISGCASMNLFSPSDVRGGTWNHIKESGIATDADHSLLLDQVEVQDKGKNLFTPADEKVIWWAHFNHLAFNSPYHVQFQAKWYDPSGNLFFEDEFPLNNILDALFVKTSLPIQTTPAKFLPGLWQVKVFYKGHMIDSKTFYIQSDQPMSYKPVSEAPSTQDLSSDVWAKFSSQTSPSASNQESEEETVFRDLYAKARQYFERQMYEESEQYLTRILKAQPYRTEAHLSLATVHYQQKNWDEALKELDYVLQRPEMRERGLKLRDHILEMKKGG